MIGVSQENSYLSSNAVNSDSNEKLRNNIFQSPKRPPLLPSEAENGPNGNSRRPKSKEIASRYLSFSTSSSSSTSTTTSSSSNSSNYMTPPRRTSSTITRSVLTTPMPSVPNSNRRSQSAERRRPMTPRAVSGDMPNASKLLMTLTRRFSAPFQGKSFSVLKSKAKPAPVSSNSASMRKEMPERRKTSRARDQRENLTSKMNDQYRLPARSRSFDSSFYTKSLDFGALAEKARGSGKGLSSPLRGSVRPASPSILSFDADVRSGKMEEAMILDAHELRLLYNRHLQWRFVNARAETSLMAQTELAERSLYNAWVTTSKLRHSVKSKRIELQLLNHNMKLCSILNRQVPSLEDWDIIERDLSNSLLGATEALEARLVRLPVVDGARADIQEVKNALYSAVDVMQTMASTTDSLLTKVEQVNMFISELASMALHERGLLSECKDLVSKLNSMEVNDCSLRAHILQLNRMV